MSQVNLPKIMTHFTTPIPLKPGFSKRLALLLIVMHSGAALLLIPLTLSGLMKGSLTLLIACSAYHHLRLHVFLSAHPVRECVLHYDTVWLPSGDSAKVLASSYCHPLFVILRVQLPTGKVSSLVILPDAVDANTFRHLQVRLRYPYVEEEE